MGTFKQTKIDGQRTGTSSPSVGVVKNVKIWLFWLFTIYCVSWDSILNSFQCDLRA
jgi:hypothetical protein